MFNFECLDIWCSSIGHQSEELSPFEFLESFGCSFFNISIYPGPYTYTYVKSYDHLNFSRASIVHFSASQYILGLTHTPKLKVMAVWMCQELPFSISRVPIYCAPELDIQVKSYDHLNFSRAFVVHFLASRYIMGLIHTLVSKVMAVWICQELPCLISSIPIYYAPESDIRVKSDGSLLVELLWRLDLWAPMVILHHGDAAEGKGEEERGGTIH